MRRARLGTLAPDAERRTVFKPTRAGRIGIATLAISTPIRRFPTERWLIPTDGPSRSAQFRRLPPQLKLANGGYRRLILSQRQPGRRRRTPGWSGSPGTTGRDRLE